MKARVFVAMLVFVFVAGFAANAQSTKSSAKATTTAKAPATSNLAKIEFDQKVLDFGTLKIGDVKKIKITYTNTGKKPLILDNVKSNCDCTEVEWSKSPVMPGKKGTMTVTYTAKHTGLISKWVTIDSNAENDRVVLKTKGEVK